MSTKAIREALDALKAALDHPNAPAVIRGVWERAEAEVEAIEKAARVVMDDATTHAISRDDEAAVDEALDLFEAVAENART